jgi:hypothetical protein
MKRGLVQRFGPAPAAWHHPISEDGVAQPRRSSVSRVRENRMHGIERGMGKRIRKDTAPLTTNERTARGSGVNAAGPRTWLGAFR